jgi:hypothetical protein
MPILPLSYNPLVARIGLVVVGLLFVLGYLYYQSRRLHKAAKPAPVGTRSPAQSDQSLFEHAVHPGSSMLSEIMRAALILLALCIAAAFILIMVPEGTVDRMAQSLRLKSGQLPPQERISLLYLGDETKGKEFHIRGVIRNISTQPIEKLDALVRLYAADGSLLETAVVRMDMETIAPDATSSFNLAYPDYAGQFGSYAVDFKLRQGDAVPFKDMRRGG